MNERLNALPSTTIAAEDTPPESLSPEALPRKNRVFCNRTLKLNHVEWIGFDMDYTLAIYDQPAMDELSIRATVEKLLKRGYPNFVRHVPHVTEFPVRGLLIDKRFGHVLKMDRYKYVCQGFHGLRELSKEELRELYHAKKVRPATSRFHWVDTLYALSEVALYAALVDALERNGLAVDYGKVFDDIRECIDEAHRDGTILDAVMADLPRFIHRDPDLASTLHKFRSAGKKLFLLTNSGWAYTDKMMTYLIGGALPEYPSWRHYFDVAIASARKPTFFTGDNPLFVREGGEQKPATFPLERGKIYEGGNVHDLERAFACDGDAVLYVGDHIYGDILRSKKESAWRTAMIIQELEAELRAHEASKADYDVGEELELLLDRLENDLRFYQARFKELTRRIERRSEPPPPVEEAAESAGANADSAESPDALEAERARVKRAVERIRSRLRQAHTERDQITKRIDGRFHPFWGSLMKEEQEQSLFGAQVENYACVYTSRVSNFRFYSPQQTFRSPRDEMAHEIG